MRCLVALALLCTATAEERDAESHFRAMLQKVRTAKILRVRYDLTVTDALGRKGAVSGSLTLGAGDRYRAEGAGRLFGEAVKFVEVSDGKNTSYKDGADPKRDTSEPTRAGCGTYLRQALPCQGFLLSTLNLGQKGALPTVEASDFKHLGREKVGDRNTEVIQYTVTMQGAKDGLSMKVWLDTATRMPAKLSASGGKSDIRDLTETYGEFSTAEEADAQLFETPK